MCEILNLFGVQTKWLVGVCKFTHTKNVARLLGCKKMKIYFFKRFSGFSTLLNYVF